MRSATRARVCVLAAAGLGMALCMSGCGGPDSGVPVGSDSLADSELCNAAFRSELCFEGAFIPGSGQNTDSSSTSLARRPPAVAPVGHTDAADANAGDGVTVDNGDSSQDETGEDGNSNSEDPARGAEASPPEDEPLEARLLTRRYGAERLEVWICSAAEAGFFGLVFLDVDNEQLGQHIDLGRSLIEDFSWSTDVSSRAVLGYHASGLQEDLVDIRFPATDRFSAISTRRGQLHCVRETVDTGTGLQQESTSVDASTLVMPVDRNDLAERMITDVVSPDDYQWWMCTGSPGLLAYVFDPIDPMSGSGPMIEITGLGHIEAGDWEALDERQLHIRLEQRGESLRSDVAFSSHRQIELRHDALGPLMCSLESA